MSETRFSKDHLWLRDEGDDTFVVGITEYAQEQLGDIMFVDLPSSGSEITENTSFGVVESVKTASDLIAPVSGKIVQVNETLKEEPWRINDSPMGEGWMLKIVCDAPDAGATLMDETAYQELTGE